VTMMIEEKSGGATATMLTCIGLRESLEGCSWDRAGAVAPRLVVVGELAAVALDVPLAEFVGEEAESKLKDLSWLGPRVTRHDALTRGAFAAGPVVPCRFGTLFADDAALVEMLRERSDRLRAFLLANRDGAEWLVKIAGDAELVRNQVVQERLRGAGMSIESTKSGAGYLMLQRAKREAAGVANERLRTGAAAVLEAIASLGGERIVAGRNESERADGCVPLAKVSCLVRSGVGAGFAGAMGMLSEVIRGDGLVVECEGPLPLYSFCADAF
jgi:hypothetical protein